MSVEKIGIDMGNSTICTAAHNERGDLQKKYVKSLYGFDIELATADIVECNGITIALGTGPYMLTTIDKTERGFIEHQILWSVYSLFGAGLHHINLGAGLPISIYKTKKQAFASKLKSLETIIGKVNGEEVTVIVSDVKVMAECHAALKTLINYLDKDNSTLIIDIGLKTTDVIKTHFDNKFYIDDFITINISLADIYSVLQRKIAKEGLELSISEIDRRLNSSNPIVRTEKGKFNLAEHIQDTSSVCKQIIREIENRFNKISVDDKIFIGGGSEVFLKVLPEFKKQNNIDIPLDMRYYANAIGYLLGLQ